MSVNVSNLELLLVNQIKNATTPLELLQYTKSLEMLKTEAVYTVSTFSDLPWPINVKEGSLYFVESDRLFYIIEGRNWRLLTQPQESTVFSWGRGLHGNLGNNNTADQSSPVSVVGNIADWCQVSLGKFHGAAIRSNKTLWTWGYNARGALGDGTSGVGTCQSSPVSVAGGFTDWCQVSAGYYSTAAVRSNGTLWTWGSNSNGQLGDNTTVSKSSPVSVVGGFTDWCQVSAGRNHSAAIRTTGSLWAWGRNNYGKLGDNTLTDRLSPVSVVGGFTDWCQVSAGNYNTAAIRFNGTLWTWGAGTCGRLGDNTAVSKSSPVSVVGGFTDWCQVSFGKVSAVAIRTNGTIWAWGCNASGQLGDNSVTARSSPVSVVGGFTDWCQVSAGYSHTAAVRTNGTLWTWGSNSNGQLGDNTAVSKSSPVSIVGGITNWSSIEAGAYGNFAIRVFDNF